MVQYACRFAGSSSAPKNSEGKDQIAALQLAFTKAGLEQEFCY